MSSATGTVPTVAPTTGSHRPRPSEGSAFGHPEWSHWGVSPQSVIAGRKCWLTGLVAALRPASSRRSWPLEHMAGQLRQRASATDMHVRRDDWTGSSDHGGS